MKTKLSIAGGFLIGAFFLWLAFRNIELRDLAAIYSKVNALYLLPFAFIVFLEIFARAARWKLLLDPSRAVKLSDAFQLETIGLALNNILPLRLGEIARAAFGGKIFDIPFVTVVATILVERALDTIVLFILFALAVKFGGLMGGFLSFGLYFWTVLSALICALLALVFADEIISHEWFRGFFAEFPALKKILERLALGVRGFHEFKSACCIVLLAACQWALDALNCYLIASAFGLAGVIDVFKSMALVFTGAAAASVPGMPGYFGNYEFAIAKVAGSWGVRHDVGFTYAGYLHLAGYVMVTLAGLVFIYREGYSLAKLWEQFRPGADRGS